MSDEKRLMCDWPSSSAAPLVKKYEGCGLTAYKCPAGYWTIGYGARYMMSGIPVQAGMKITQTEADRLLSVELARVQAAIARYCPHKVTEGQMIALVDFAYNLGVTKAARSTLFRRLKETPLPVADCAYEFRKWRFSQGRELPGLVRRREAEKNFFLHGTETP